MKKRESHTYVNNINKKAYSVNGKREKYFGLGVGCCCHILSFVCWLFHIGCSELGIGCCELGILVITVCCMLHIEHCVLGVGH